MLEPPSIPPDAILSAIRAEFGLPVTRLTFLPLGGDLSTAVYRAESNSAAYFCKLREGDFHEVPVALPKFLAD